MYGLFHSRRFFAWRMLAEAGAQDERNYLRHMRANIRASYNAEDLPEREFVNNYRLSKDAFTYLCSELREHTDLKSTQRISLELKVLTALFFYSNGSYQRPIGAARHLSQKMCSVYIQEVTQALIHPNMVGRYIQFPQTVAERQEISHKFYVKYGIPGVIGCIDGSHFKIFSPPKEIEHMFYGRKHHYSLNVQMICDSEYRIINVNPKYGGANHDSFIWENSQVNSYVQSLHRSGEVVWLLGDSGYPQRPWLMTPIADAVDESPEAKYNSIHGTTRVVIENVFGRLKNRWRCLSKDRVLHYKPHKCAQIIKACCVLYNFALQFGVPEPDPEGNLDQINNEDNIPGEPYREQGAATTELIRGRALREQLVRRLQN